MDNLFDTENETALLGILVRNPYLMSELQNIKPFMFSSEVNKELFSAMHRLYSDEHVVPDVDLLTNFLGAIGKLDTVGGTDYLNYLKGRTVKEENLKKYESLIVDSYKARMVIGMSAEVPGIIRGSGIDIAMQHITKMIDNLSATMGGETTTALIDALKESWAALAKKMQNPGQVGFSTGFTSIDKIIGGMDVSDLWIIAARPSMGKSAWMCNAALGSAKIGNPCLIFSYEMTKQQLIERFLAIETGLSIIDIHLGLVDNKGSNKIVEVIELIKSLPIFIDAFPGDINYVCSTIKRYHKTYGIKIVYIDYVQLMTERGDDQTAELGRISRKLKLLAKDLGIAIIVLSQLNREVEKLDDKRPLSAHLRQSGNLEEDADKVVMLYRDVVYKPDTKNKKEMEFIIRKNRQGPIGTIALEFTDTTNRITDGK